MVRLFVRHNAACYISIDIRSRVNLIDINRREKEGSKDPVIENLNLTVGPEITRSDLDVKSIPLSRIVQADNSRLTYNEEEMISLMVSMKQTGLLQPIGVTETEKKGEYRVILGNRRYLAAKKLGWKKIDATVFKTRDYVSEVIANLTENLVRGDVALAELGRTFHMLTQEGLTLGEIAARISVTKNTVKAGLDAFNRVPVKFRNKISHGARRPGMISGSSMTKILNMKLSEADKEKMFEAAIGREMSKNETDALAGYIKKGYTPEEAAKAVETKKTVVVALQLEKTVYEKLIAKYGGSMNKIILNFLRQIPELEL